MVKVPPMLVKLLMMTTSSNDSEALVAMRKANAMLAGANVNWAEFLEAVELNKTRQDQSFRTPPSQRKHRHDDDDENAFTDVGKGPVQKFNNASVIDPLFNQAFAKVGNSGFRSFLESIHDWWEDKGFLTEKQYYALKRSAEG